MNKYTKAVLPRKHWLSFEIKCGLIVSILGFTIAFVISRFSGIYNENLIAPSLEITSKSAPFINIDSIVVDSEKLYVSDIHSIKVFALNGSYLYSIGKQGSGEGEFADEVIGLAFNPAGELLAVDHNNYRIQAFDKAGNFIRTFGSQGSQAGQFLSPQGIIVNSQGLIYVSDNKRNDVQVFSPTGEYLYHFGNQGSKAQTLTEPESMAIQNNYIFVADEGNQRIQVYDLWGMHVKQLPHNGLLITEQQRASLDDAIFETHIDKLYDRSFDNDVEGIVFDSQGRLYFIDEDTNRIGVFKNDIIQGYFSSTTPFSSADGIAYSKDLQQIYVCDQGGNRVLAFSTRTIESKLEQ